MWKEPKGMSEVEKTCRQDQIRTCVSMLIKEEGKKHKKQKRKEVQRSKEGKEVLN